MAALTTADDTEFTPAVGDFIAQSTGAAATLLRKNASGAAFASAGRLTPGQAVIVNNPIAGAVYKFAAEAGAAVRADQ